MALWDPDLAEHSRRTAEMALQLAEHLHADPRNVSALDWAAHLHDIGKTALPRAILDKVGTLTEDEWRIIRSHPVHSFVILHRTDISAEFLLVVLLHHERFDGRGYPVGLKGEDIPLAARLLAVADVYSALTSRRPYRDHFPSDQALAMIRMNSGHAFDPQIVAALTEIVRSQ